MESSLFFLVKDPAKGLFKDKGSKFLSYIFSIKTEDEVKQHLQNLKKEHPTARHFCYAYRIGTTNIKYRFNDDGEPNNSAGQPILRQILSHNLTNCLIIVVRYFGGTLLGVSGLINAYKNAAIEAIQASCLMPHQIENYYLIKFNFTKINEVMRIVKNYDIKIIKQDAYQKHEFIIAILTNKANEALFNFNKILNLDVEFLYAK